MSKRTMPNKIIRGESIGGHKYTFEALDQEGLRFLARAESGSRRLLQRLIDKHGPEGRPDIFHRIRHETCGAMILQDRRSQAVEGAREAFRKFNGG